VADTSNKVKTVASISFIARPSIVGKPYDLRYLHASARLVAKPDKSGPVRTLTVSAFVLKH
jgi:hypothetical protein